VFRDLFRGGSAVALGSIKRINAYMISAFCFLAFFGVEALILAGLHSEQDYQRRMMEKLEDDLARLDQMFDEHMAP
jgi:hypothetical protein